MSDLTLTGNLDSVVGSTTNRALMGLNEACTIAGWATSSTGISSVELWIDVDKVGYTNRLGYAERGLPMVPGYPVLSGWRLSTTAAAVGEGSHVITARAHNLADTDTVTIGSMAVNVLSVFPVLSKPPARNGYNQEPQDDTITTNTDGGYDYSRPRNTMLSRNEYVVPFELMTDTDKVILQDFLVTVGNCAEKWIWVDPTDGTSHVVKFKALPKYEYRGYEGSESLWDFSFTIREDVSSFTNKTPFQSRKVYGTRDGVNQIFVLSIAKPPAPGTLQVFLNGLLQVETRDYYSSGRNIVFVVPPQPTDNITAFC